ncbi:MAG: glycoside hydrolase family 3 N-terminal domain-containing protein [Planctomycetota bacterium]
MQEHHTASTLGAMFMVGVRGAEAGDEMLEADLEACAGAGITNVILFSEQVPEGGDRNVRSPEQVARLTDHIRKKLGPSTVIAVDQEGGIATRLGPEHGFADTVSASAYAEMDHADRARYADRFVRDIAAVGIDWNLAPCVDVDHDPPCPVIGELGRAFSMSPSVVISRARELIEAHDEHGVAVCLKHFPGHGAASDDSHFQLPDVTERHRGDVDLAPFRELLQEDNSGTANRALLTVMTAHVLHRELDAKHPASLSHAITTGLLRKKLGFDGVVITDSMDMNAVRETRSLLNACRSAILAGADIIVDGCNAPIGDTASDVAEVVRSLEEEARNDETRLRCMIEQSAPRRAMLLRALGRRADPRETLSDSSL